MLPLFRQFPALAASVPHVSLGTFPTPVRPWRHLETEARAGTLYVKCDDVTGLDYGGNKVRKLEFLLAAAQARGMRSVLTFGAVGSNHALATAIYAAKLGLRPISMLAPQPDAPSIRQNLLRGQAAGAELHHFLGRQAVSEGTVARVIDEVERYGKRPYIIPAGGSAPLGTVGFVNAAFELRDQVVAGELPEPDAIYVASGTMGTCVGLLIGLTAAGMKTRVEAVRVTAPPFTSLDRARQLFARTVGLLRKHDPAFPALDFPEMQFCLRDGFLGAGYARATGAGTAAVAALKAREGVRLEGTYTGKALACLLVDGVAGRLSTQTVVFWNTYNGRPLAPGIKDLDACQLPADFHRYFEEPVHISEP